VRKVEGAANAVVACESRACVVPAVDYAIDVQAAKTGCVIVARASDVTENPAVAVVPGPH